MDLQIASYLTWSLIGCTQKNSVMALGKGCIKIVPEACLQFQHLVLWWWLALVGIRWMTSSQLG